jgi:hypothetical protein
VNSTVGGVVSTVKLDVTVAVPPSVPVPVTEIVYGPFGSAEPMSGHVHSPLVTVAAAQMTVPFTLTETVPPGAVPAMVGLPVLMSEPLPGVVMARTVEAVLTVHDQVAGVVETLPAASIATTESV